MLRNKGYLLPLHSASEEERMCKRRCESDEKQQTRLKRKSFKNLNFFLSVRKVLLPLHSASEGSGEFERRGKFGDMR